MAIERRTLTFATLDEIVDDAEHLLTKGYDRAGNWDLAQAAGHVSEWLRFPIEGFPKVPIFIRPVLWLMRVMGGKGMLEKILRNGFEPGGRTMNETVPAAGGDAAAAVAKLRAMVEKWNQHTGDVFPSPLFGAMTRDTALQLQLRHAAHHMSFLIPKGA